MASSSKCLVALISVANILIIILGIVIICLSLNQWNDYATCAFTILIAICWSCCICVENNVVISCYTVMMVIDVLLLLANAIYHTVMHVKYSNFCFDGGYDLTEAPKWGCHDWRTPDGGAGEYYHRSIGMIICYFLAFLFRLFNIIGSCLLARNLYHS